MKKTMPCQVILLNCLFFLFSTTLFSQSVSISDDGSPAAPSAMLDVKVNGPVKKGVLIPRVTTAQRNAIAAPAKGLMVYDSTNKNFFFHNGTAWLPLSSGVPNSWAISGTNIYNNNVGNVGIGLSVPKTKLHVAANKTVLFGADSLISDNGSQFVWFATKGALRFRKQKDDGYPIPQPYSYNAIGIHSLAIGECIAGPYSLALGTTSNAGYESFAHGFGAFADRGSFAKGSYATATGELSFSQGFTTLASGNISFAQGEYVEASAFNCFSIGNNNDPIPGSSATTWVAKDPLFIIGNGGLGTKSNALVVLKNGVTGIGQNPVGDNASWGLLQLKNIASRDHLSLVQNTTTNRWGAAVADAGAADLFLKYNGVSKGKFSTVNGAYTLVSDRRLKKDLTPAEEALPKLMKLQAFNYHYIDNASDDPLSHGFIAQDVAELFPSFVARVTSGTDSDMLGIDYNNFTVLAIKAIQEQQGVIKEQAAAIQQQQTQIDELVKRLVALEKKQ